MPDLLLLLLREDASDDYILYENDSVQIEIGLLEKVLMHVAMFANCNQILHHVTDQNCTSIIR